MLDDDDQGVIVMRSDAQCTFFRENDIDPNRSIGVLKKIWGYDFYDKHLPHISSSTSFL